MPYVLLFLLVVSVGVHGVSLQHPTTRHQEDTTLLPWLSLMGVHPPLPAASAVPPQGDSGLGEQTLAAALIHVLRRATSAARVLPCPYPYTKIIHECFFVHKKKLTWSQGRRVCQGMSGDLAEPRHIYALQTHLADTYGPGYFWLGANNENSDGVWRWLSGRTLDPADWLFSRPDNQGGDENCLEMVMSDHPKVFNDETCTLAQRFICQYRPE